MRRGKVLFAAVLVILAVVFSIGHGEVSGRRGVVADRWFVIRIKGQAVGYLHAVRKASEDASAPILLEHESLVDWKKEKVWLSVQTYCEDNNYFSLGKASAKIRRAGKDRATLEAVMEKETVYGCSKRKMRLVYRPGDKKYELDKKLPEHTLTAFTLLELIPRLPFTEGPVVEFNFLDMKKMKVRKKHKIAYLGLEKIEIGGRERALHKFEQKGGGIKKIHYWVDDNHQLLRILKGKKEELLLSSRAEAWKRPAGW